jgi:hypothetical protein
MAWTNLGTVAPGDVLRANSGTAAYNSIVGNLNEAPRGLIATARQTGANQGSITTVTDVTGVTVTFTAVASRYYVVEAAIVFAATAGTPALQSLQITNSAASVTYEQNISYFGIGGGNIASSRLISRPLTLTAGSNTIKLRFGRAGGDAATYSIDNTNNPPWIAVYDAGAV